MSTTTIQTIQETISTEKEWIIHLRRHFHQYPEASLKEYETIKRIKEELLALAIPFCRSRNGCFSNHRRRSWRQNDFVTCRY